MKAFTRRESGLLILVFLSAVVIGYPQFRYKSLKAGLQDVESRTKASNAKLKNVDWPKEPNQTPAEINAELTKAKSLLQEARKRLDTKEARLVSQEDVLDVQELRVKISALARENGIRIKQNIPLKERKKDSEKGSEKGTAKAEGRLLEQLKSGDPYSRPLQELQMTATYSRLRQFLKGLNGLSHAVSVVWFEIQVAPVGRRETLLSVTIILAL